MSEATQAPTLEQTLNKTDFGHGLLEHKKSLLAIVVTVLIVVTGYTIWKQVKNKANLEIAQEVYEFESKTWSSAKEGKLDLSEAVKKFEALGSDVHSSASIVPVALEMGQFMYQKNALTEAEAVLSKVNNSDALVTFFIGMQRAVILEKANRVPEAIAVLETIAKNKETLMAAKVNLELGRLNLSLGEKGKAQTHLEYVAQTFPNDENAKLAKLYLSKLAQ